MDKREILEDDIELQISACVVAGKIRLRMGSEEEAFQADLSPKMAMNIGTQLIEGAKLALDNGGVDERN